MALFSSIAEETSVEIKNYEPSAAIDNEKNKFLKPLVGSKRKCTSVSL
jgi:hypothetical protein